MWFFEFFMIWGVPLGSLWASFSLLFVKILIFFEKGGTPDFERQYNVFATFWRSGPPRKAPKGEKT